MNSSKIARQLITLPTRLAARGVGFARGSLHEGRRLVREAAAPAAGWPSPSTDSAAAVGDEVAAGEDSAARSGPVNVNRELGLDPAPLPRPRTPRRPAVTGIDQQAEPGLVESTPADVARRLRHGDDGGSAAED